MAPLSRLDDPEFITKFLDVMHARPPSSLSHTRPQAQVASSNMNPESPEFSPGCLSLDNKLGCPIPSIAAPQSEVGQSEQQGPTPSWQIPRSSPFPQISTLQETGNNLVQDENCFVTEAPVPTLTAKEQVLPPRHLNGRAPYRGKCLTPTQHRLLMGKKPGVERLTKNKLSEMQQQTHGYMDNVIEGFRQFRQRSASPGIKHDSGSESGSISFPEMDETPIHSEVQQPYHTIPSETPDKQKDSQKDKANTRPFNTPDSGSRGSIQHKKQPQEILPTSNKTVVISTSDNIKLSTHGSQAPSTPTRKTILKDKTAPPSPRAAAGEQVSIREQDSLDGGVKVENNPKASEDAFKYSQSPTIVVAVNTETDDSVAGRDNIEDRENLARFKSWGMPTTRDKPKSRQRTIILSGLPRSADLTLVQSFIHGGAIECMRLVSSSPESVTIAAHVTFISSEACDRYYDKYPNGFDVRHQGKKWPVLVYKRDGVDVVSGMLQGYLECGATRVVKVNNADDDWGIVALNKLAERKAGTRQVEAVHDTYHNRTRTIIFRFANIEHAVKFKGILIRSDDWEGCHIEFAEDPCARATGVHSE